MAKDQTRSKQGLPAAALVCFVLLLMYVLSIGPAITLIGATGCNETAIRVFTWAYVPLLLMPKFETAIQPWVDFWDFYGVTRGGC